jgi:hypothetical protein
MKKFFFFFPFSFFMAQVKALEIEPGLWKIQTIVDLDGKKYDTQNEYKKMMSAVPADQRKKVEEALQKSLKKQQLTLSKDGTSKICYSKKALQNPTMLTPQSKNCKITLLKNTQNKLQSSFVCKENTSGTIEWNVVDRKKFNGVIVSKNAQGTESRVLQIGKYMSSNCGALKSFKTR